MNGVGRKKMSLPFGELLFQIRRRRRLRQKAVATTAGVTPSYLAGLEGGRREAPSDEVLDRLLKALEATKKERQQLYQALKIIAVRQAISAGSAPLEGGDILLRLLQRMPLREDDISLLELLIPKLGRDPHNEEETEM